MSSCCLGSGIWLLFNNTKEIALNLITDHGSSGGRFWRDWTKNFTISSSNAEIFSAIVDEKFKSICTTFIDLIDTQINYCTFTIRLNLVLLSPANVCMNRWHLEQNSNKNRKRFANLLPHVFGIFCVSMFLLVISRFKHFFYSVEWFLWILCTKQLSSILTAGTRESEAYLKRLQDELILVAKCFNTKIMCSANYTLLINWWSKMLISVWTK